jgi:hypothetical protein
MSRDYRVTAVLDDTTMGDETATRNVMEVELPTASLAERVFAAFAGHYRVVEGPHLWWRTSPEDDWRLVPQPEVTYVLRVADEGT